jgi:hypothetical protein
MIPPPDVAAWAPSGIPAAQKLAHAGRRQAGKLASQLRAAER